MHTLNTSYALSESCRSCHTIGTLVICPLMALTGIDLVASVLLGALDIDMCAAVFE